MGGGCRPWTLACRLRPGVLGRPHALPPPVPVRRPIGRARLSRPRRGLLLRRRLARRRLPGGHRGLLRAPRHRGDRAPGRRRATPTGHRGGVPGRTRPNRQAHGHRCVLPLGQPRPDLESRGPVAPGAHHGQRSGPPGPAASLVHRGHRGPGPHHPRPDRRRRRRPRHRPPAGPPYRSRSRPQGGTGPDPGRGREPSVLDPGGRPPAPLVAVALWRPAPVRPRDRGGGRTGPAATAATCAPPSGRCAWTTGTST